MKLMRYLSILLCCISSITILIGCSNANKDNSNSVAEKDYTITLEKEYYLLTADDERNIYGVNVVYPESGTSDSNAFADTKVSMDIMNSKGKITKTLNLPNGNVSTLSVNKSNIFVFYFEKISILDLGGKLIKEITFSNDVYMAKPISFGDKVFFMYQDSLTGYSSNMELAYVDSKSDTINKPGIGDIYNIMKYKDNILKLYSYDANGDIKSTNFDCVGLNVKGSNTEIESGLDIETQYSQSNDKLYSFNYSGLFEKKYGESSSRSLISFENSEYTSMQLSGSTLYLFGPYDKKIRVLDIKTLDEKGNSQNQIVIYSQDGAITDNDVSLTGKAIQKFKQNHPDTVVSFQYVSYEKYYDELNTKVMTQDNSFDIFYLPESKVNNYIKNGVMANLKDNNVLMDKFNKNINPKISKVISRDDYYFGVPIVFLSNVMTFNIDKFNELSIDVPSDIWTYDEYFSILDTLKEKDRNLYFQTSQIDYFYLIDYINYSVDVNNKKVNIDREKLTNILSKLKEIQEYSDTAYEDEGIEYINTFLIAYGPMHDSENENAETKFFNPPVVSKDDPKYFVPGTEFLAVNKKSKNVNLACELLSYIYEEDIIMSREAMNLLPIYKDMFKYNDILKSDLMEELGGASTPTDVFNRLYEQQKITDDYVRIYDNILDNYGPSVEIFNTDAGSKILDDFIDGKITANEASDKIISLVKNMVEE